MNFISNVVSKSKLTKNLRKIEKNFVEPYENVFQVSGEKMFSSLFGVQRKYCVLPVSPAAEFWQVIPPILARLFNKIKFHTKRRKGVCFLE